MGLSSMVDRLTAHRWTEAEVTALVGDHMRAAIAHASSAEIREFASSGGAVSALLISMIESGTVDGALVCVTSVDEGRVRARYRIARTAEEVLAARGSTYVLADFVREALPLIEAFDGTLAVVALPCEITVLKHRPELDAKVKLRIALFCGHASEPELIDTITERLGKEAGGSRLTGYRFRTGHWRGRLQATFEDGTVVEKPSGYFNLYQNLYLCCPKKCLFCGDHFGYDADISAGDLWSQKYKKDPVKHTALIVKTCEGAEAIHDAEASGLLEVAPVPIAEVLDGQRRVAPFHFNVSARSQAGTGLGMRIPDKTRMKVRWHERLVAKMVIKNHLATRTPDQIERELSRPRRLLKARLYFMKGLESLPTGPLVSTPAEGSKRFGVIAATIWGNRGAEAMLETTIGRLRERAPGSTFVVYSYLPEADRRLVTDPAVTVRSATPKHLVLVLFPASLLLGLLRLLGFGRAAARFMPASVRDLYSCDALVDLAGVSFIDGREKFLPFNLLTIWPAMLLGVRVFKLSQALGPFEHLPTKLAARTLRQCAMVVPRGEGTLRHLQAFGFPEELTYPAPDVAFAFEERDALSREGAEEVDGLLCKVAKARAEGRVVVGLCPSSVIAGKAAEQGWDYIEFLARIAEGLAAEGATVLLFPNATRKSSGKLRNNDLPVIDDVTGRLAPSPHRDSVLSVRGDVNAAEIRSLVAVCDTVAVSRFHAMVAALTAEVPVLVLGWSHKYAEVMGQFGLEEWVLDYGDHDPEAFLVRLRQLLAEKEWVRESISAVLPSVRERSVAQFDELLRRLEGRSE